MIRYKLYIVIILIALLVVQPITSDRDIGPEDIDEEEVRELVSGEVPTFTKIETTFYYTPSREEFDEWSSGAYEDYDLTTSLGWCVIPESEMGFYEDIMCQGSGVYQGRVYHYEDTEATPADSTALEGDFTQGITATGTDPQEKWTVAVNPVEGTECYIPYGTIMYIDFGQGHEWNGVYKAEDTGPAFQGECKMDIYAGIGESATDVASEEDVSGQFPNIYLLDDDLEETIDPSEVSATYGDVSSHYTHRKDISEAEFFFDELYGFVDRVSNNCGGVDVEGCIDSTTDEFDINLTSQCPVSGYEYSTIGELQDDLQDESNFPVVAGEVVATSEDSFESYDEVQEDELLLREFYEGSNILLNVDDEIALGEYIRVLNASLGELKDIGSNDNSFLAPSVSYDDLESSSKHEEADLAIVSSSIAECFNSQGNCTCDVEMPGANPNIEFLDGFIKLQEEYTKLDINISHQSIDSDKFIVDSIDSNLSFYLDQEGDELLALEEEDDYVGYDTCNPNKRFIPYCATNKKEWDNKKYYEGRNDYLSSEFVINI